MSETDPDPVPETHVFVDNDKYNKHVYYNTIIRNTQI